MIFTPGQKCLYLFEGSWRPCEIEEVANEPGMYWIKVMRGESWDSRYCPEELLKPIEVSLRPLPGFCRQWDDLVPAPYGSLEQMVEQMVSDTDTFMKGYRNDTV